MTAVWAVAVNESGKHPVAVAADAEAAEYVTADGVHDFYTSRLDALLETIISERPDNYMDWLVAATDGLGLNWRVMGEATSRGEAKDAARTYIDKTPVGAARPTVLSVATAYEDLDLERELSPDEELDAMLELAGGVDPEQPHMWLPPFVGAEECVFCEKPESDTLHPNGVTMPGNVSARDLASMQNENANPEGES